MNPLVCFCVQHISVAGQLLPGSGWFRLYTEGTAFRYIDREMDRLSEFYEVFFFFNLTTIDIAAL